MNSNLTELNKLTGNKLPDSYLKFLENHSGDYVPGLNLVRYIDNYQPFGKSIQFLSLDYIPTIDSLIRSNRLFIKSDLIESMLEYRDNESPSDECLDRINDLYDNYFIIFDDGCGFLLLFNKNDGRIRTFHEDGEAFNFDNPRYKETFIADSFDKLLTLLGYKKTVLKGL